MSISNPSPDKKKSLALPTVIVLGLVQAAFGILLLTIGARESVPAMQIGGSIALVIAANSAIAAVLIFRGKIATGGWLVIGAVGLLVPALSAFGSGLGWMSLLAIPLIIAWVARQTLPGDRVRWAITIGVFAGAVSFLMEIYGPANRPVMPQVQLVIPAVVVLLTFAAVVVVARNFRNYRLQTKLLIMFLLVALIPLSLLAFLNYRLTSAALTEAANQSLLSVGEQTRDRVDAFFEETARSIQQEANISLIRTYLTSVVEEQFLQFGNVSVALSTLHEQNPRIRTYAILDRDGNVLLSYPKQQRPPFMGVSPEFQRLMQNAMLLGRPYYTPVLFDEHNQASIFFVAPIYHISKSDIPAGLLLVQYDAVVLQDLIASQNELAGPKSFGVLFDENQLHLAHGTAPETLYKTVAPLPAEQVEYLISIGRLPNLPPEELTTNLPDLSARLSAVTAADPFFSAIDVATGDSINQVAVTALNQQRGWQVSFFQPQEVYLATVQEQARRTLPFILLSAIIVAAASFGATRSLAAPLTNLTDLVEHIAAGDLSVQLPVVTEDEIGRLATAFNAMTSQIRGLLSGLENQVAERTRELERQALQLQTAAQVARDASALQNLHDLLDRVVNLIYDRFGFYHAGVFLLDERGEYAILQAANSEGGKEMLRRGHRLKVGETGIVGYVTSRGEPRIALDVDADTAHFAHPLLPATRSEMALPLRVGNRIIGALDVQSTEANAFDESDITVLQVLADQLAVAIENARLLGTVRQTVDELQAAYAASTREAWLKWAQRAGKPIGYRYRGLEVEPAPDKAPETVLAIKQKQIITKVVADSSAGTTSALAIPIQLRGQAFGAIHLRINGDEIPADLVDLIENISDRLATALESARLYEETQQRAAQERLTSEITSRIRETLDIETILRTASEEIRRALNLPEVVIQLGEPPETQRPGGQP